MEIERKFLVPHPPADLETFPSEPVTQGYLLGDPRPEDAEVRVRRKGGACFLTIKHGQGLQRMEVELPLAAQDYETLWLLTAGRRLEKIRYRLPHDPWTIEVDVYRGALAGLLTAEVEFPSTEAAHSFQPPSFFGREVTEDTAYRNGALARHGLPAEP